MKGNKFISSDQALSGFAVKYSDSFSTFDEDICKMYLDEGIAKLLTADSHRVFVAHLNLNKQGKVSLPNNFKYPIQIAYRDIDDINHSDPKTRVRVAEYIERGITEHCNLKIELDCKKCKKRSCICSNEYPIEIDVTQTILGANPELMIGYNRFLMGYTSSSGSNSYRSNIHNGFTIIRPTSSYYFNLPREIQGCQVPDMDTFLEYNIENNILEVNNGGSRNYPYGFTNSILKDCLQEREGEVLISYIGVRMDENGFMLVPDNLLVLKYLEAYLLQAFAMREYTKDRTQSSRVFWVDMKQEMLKCFATANSELRIPNKVEWEEIMRNIMLKSKADFRTNSSGNYTFDRGDHSSYPLSQISNQVDGYGR